MDTLYKKKILHIYTIKNKKNGLQCVINGVHVHEIITILVMAGKKQDNSDNQDHMSCFLLWGFEKLPLVDTTCKRSPNRKEKTIMYHCQQQPKK